MVAPADESYEAPKLVGRSTGHGLYLLVDDVAALHGAVLQAGGSSVFAPEKTEWGTEWGTERARVLGAVTRWMAKQKDDLSLLVIRYRGVGV